MKMLIAPLAALAVLATTAVPALAAPPAYCALYAREYANQFAVAAGEKPDSEPKIQDEAYYRCLNMDQEPEMPTTSAYYGTSVDTAGHGGPQEPTPGAAAPNTATAAAPATRSYTGGKTPWSPEWLAACRKYFPNSFNEKDGTILPHGSNKRVLCR